MQCLAFGKVIQMHIHAARAEKFVESFFAAFLHNNVHWERCIILVP